MTLMTACAPIETNKPLRASSQYGQALARDRKCLGARGTGQVPEHGTCRVLQRPPPEARGSGGKNRQRCISPKFPRCRWRGGRWFNELTGELKRKAEGDRRPDSEGDQRAAGLPQQCRAGIPHPVAHFRTLSGGESQRIRLASQIGSGLTGVLYVLDEPSIGLHQRDNAAPARHPATCATWATPSLWSNTTRKRSATADYVVDMGPGAGDHGGHVVAEGTPEEVMAKPASLTGQYLTGMRQIR